MLAVVAMKIGMYVYGKYTTNHKHNRFVNNNK